MHCVYQELIWYTEGEREFQRSSHFNPHWVPIFLFLINVYTTYHSYINISAECCIEKDVLSGRVIVRFLRPYRQRIYIYSSRGEWALPWMDMVGVEKEEKIVWAREEWSEESRTTVVMEDINFNLSPSQFHPPHRLSLAPSHGHNFLQRWIDK